MMREVTLSEPQVMKMNLADCSKGAVMETGKAAVDQVLIIDLAVKLILHSTSQYLPSPTLNRLSVLQ